MIDFQILPDPGTLASRVAETLVARIQAKPDMVLGLATGGTMESVYDSFCGMAIAKQLDLTNITSFNLDEYIGLGKDHPQSYYYYMQHFLFDRLKFDDSKIHLPSCQVPDIQAFCKDYSDQIKAHGGLDLQILGIGTNGHIGFNEPGTSFNSYTHVVELSQQTRKDNSRFFDHIDEVPNSAITMGLQDIFGAREVILVASGPNKAEIIRRLKEEGVSEQLPASILHKHGNATVYLDEAAAAGIR